MPDTNKMDENDKFISCSRCKCKYHNTSESISKHFGYKRLGDRYKSCIKCRTNKIKPDVKAEERSIPDKKPSEGDSQISECAMLILDSPPECCVCLDELKQDNTCTIKCGHGICKSCVYNMFPNFYNTNILKCPICRREYSTNGEEFEFEFEPILFKVVYRGNRVNGGSHPSNLFCFTGKRDLMMDFPGVYIIDQTWMKRTKTLIDIIYPRYKSGACCDPMVLYMYKKGNASFTLKTNKPLHDEDLVDLYDFYECQQNVEIIQSFVKTELAKSSFKVEI